MSDDNEPAEKVYSYDPEETAATEVKISEEAKIRSMSSNRQSYWNFKPDKKKLETPLEKLQRLQYEVELFQNDLKILSTDDTVPKRSAEASVDISNIEGEFSAVLNDIRIAPYIPKDTPQSKAAIVQDDSEIGGAIVDQLKDFGGGGKDGVAYGLYNRDTSAGESKTLIRLDRRIGALEKKIGTIDDADTMGFSEVNTCLSELYRKLELLDGHKLEAIQRRVSSLTTELELLEGNMPKLRGNKKSEKKFNELYAYMMKLNHCTLELPFFVARLKSQRDVHLQHAEALIRLQKCQRQQLALNNLLIQDKDRLNSAGASIAANLATMKNNMKSFKERMAALEKNAKKL